MKKEKKELPRVVVLSQELASEEMPKLFKTFDAFVLPSRGEGWGLPIMEAMSMGYPLLLLVLAHVTCHRLPVIATNWSGPTEFMTSENSYPLQVEALLPVSPFSDDKWAQVETLFIHCIHSLYSFHYIHSIH